MSLGHPLVRHAWEQRAAGCGRLHANTRERRLVMAKFLFVYRRSSDVAITPEAMQERLKLWDSWIGEGLRKGWLLDSGDGLTQEGRVVNARNVVTDGPFVESKEIVGGYSIVQAETIDAAAKLTEGCPVLRFGGSVEVRGLAGYTASK
jgi:hypothetical protein